MSFSERRKSRTPPPDMSETRIVLLGKSSSEISRVGNFILDREVFDSEAPLPSVEQHSGRARGTVEGRYFTLITTPHLFDPQLTNTQFTQRVRECFSLCAPGPHVIVLVLQPDDFTETDRHRVHTILTSLSEEALKRTLVLMTPKLLLGSSVDEEYSSQKIITECSNRCFTFNSECSRSALVEHIQKITEEKDGSFLQWEEFEDAPLEREHGTARAQEESGEANKEQKLSESLNLVLCGSNRVLKSSISDLILGQREHSPESSSVCVRREGEVCGRLITLVEMPALYNTQLSEEEVMRETFCCVSLCDPGVHAFLLIVPEGHFTDEDKGEIEKIQKVFGSRFNNHSIFLITTNTQQQAVELDNSVKIIAETYKGNVYVLDAKGSSGLLEKVQQMVEENGGGCYTTAMYSEAQVETLLKYRSENEELKSTISLIRKQKIQAPEEGGGDLRVVLMGKTGVGKSTTGNTILGKEVFEELPSSQSVTSVCQKESAEVSGRRITVIDTPGLFDTNISHEEITKEIAKCITMAAPGPHAFLLVLTVGRFTQEEKEVVMKIQELFGEESKKYTMVLFTRGDDLKRRSLKTYIKNSDRSLQNLIHQCGDRYHAFNNRNPEERTQVTALLEKIDSMVSVNGGSFYTNEMFLQVEKALQAEQERILKERQEEIEREKEELKAQYEAEMEKMKRTLEEERERLEKEKTEKEKEFLEREEQIKKETDKKLKNEMEQRLKTQREEFNNKMQRKDQNHEEQMKRNMDNQKEQYEREKENVRRQAEKKARQQAEKEFCERLERELAKARAEGKKDAQVKAYTGGAVIGGIMGAVGGPIGAAAGAAAGGVIGAAGAAVGEAIDSLVRNISS